MANESDRRVQLRESIHEMVTSAAARRGVSPAAFISMLVYDHLRTCGELNTPVAPAPKKSVTPQYLDPDALVAEWEG